jgi:flagellar motor switch protein FliM
MSALQPLTAQAFRAAGEKNRDSHPQLPQAFTRFAKALCKNFTRLSASPPSFVYESFSPGSGAVRAEADHAAFMLEGLAPSRMVRVVIDRALVFGLCDLMLGGVGNEPPFVEERPLSRLELALAELVAVEIGTALPHSFPEGSVEPLTLRTAAEDRPVFEAVLSIVMLGTIHGYSGDLRLELSQALVDVLKPQAAALDEAAAKPGMDTVNVDLTAILTQFPMSLDEIGRLGRGQLIRLGATAATPVSVSSGGVELFKARLGQGERRFCLGVI